MTFYKRHRESICFAAFIIAFVIFAAVFTRLCTPVRTSYGAAWQPYLTVENDTVEVMAFGSSIAYCDVDPAVIEEQTGRSAYVMGGPEQTLRITQAYIEQCLETQSPSVVFVEVTGAFFGEYMAYTRANIGQMPWGMPRLTASVRAAETDVLPGLIFPLYDYHGRLYSMSAEELKLAVFGAEGDVNRGYMPMQGTAAEINPSVRTVEASDATVADNLACLERIAELCESNGIRAVFFLSPTFYTLPDDAKAMLAKTLEGREYFDFSDASVMQREGLDDTADYYDTLHLNENGAAEFTSVLCRAAGLCG